jgi:hypothetical protein
MNAEIKIEEISEIAFRMLIGFMIGVLIVELISYAMERIRETDRAWFRANMIEALSEIREEIDKRKCGEAL